MCNKTTTDCTKNSIFASLSKSSYFGLNHISAGTVDYTGGEEVRANLLKGRFSAKPEAHELKTHG